MGLVPVTRENEEDKGHDEGVAEVEEGGGRSLYLQLGGVVVQRVEEEVAGGEAAGEEGAPPPAVVLGAQVEVAEEDGRLHARDHQDQEDHAQEAEHVVELVRPNTKHLRAEMT